MVPLNVKRVAVTPIRQNCTILWDERNHAIVVDPGGDVDDLLQELNGLTVDAILLTHGHLDHAGGADELRARLTEAQGQSVPVLGPDRRDAFLLSTIEKQAAHFGLNGMVSVVPDRFLEDGETLRLLGHDIEVRHLPGHTPGHVVFIDHASGRAIVGDTLFRRTVGRTDFAYGDSEALIAGIRQQLLSLPDDTVVLCGHGMPTTIGEERCSNPFLVAGL
ncbi:MBL fold metallo-hydrolase [Gluconobacter frateurii]|uniref:MBL fold metallo-hydrolase n=1 Tax=Gluconobacter frateurii TaxID=38308 RepID=UPI001F05FB9C|nr:MBL fold metallo-hydrolase [Gluconobacter frateurii]UMM09644.1 MBL fold metallo-hydrolase [Gluconobacter frateurii]